MLRHLKLHEKHGKHRLLIINAVIKAYTRNGLDTVRHIYPPGTRQAVLDEYADSNARVALEYLGRPDAVLFRETIDQACGGTTDISLPDADILVDEIGRSAVAHLLKRHRVLDRRIRNTEAADGSAANLLLYYLRRPRRLLRPILDSDIGSLTVGHLLLNNEILAFAQRLGLAQYRGGQRRTLIAALEALSSNAKPEIALPPAGAMTQADPVEVCRQWLEPMLDRLAAGAADKSAMLQAKKSRRKT